MEFTVIPHLTSERAATLWFGVSARQRPKLPQVRISGLVLDLGGCTWTPLAVDDPPLAAPFWYFRHTVDGLASDTVYRVRAALDGQPHAARATFRTLPARLPRTGVDSPLRVDLRSCFFGKQGRATARVPRADLTDPPHLKILCGDQVYLDLPWYQLLLGAEDRLFGWLDKYRENWSRLGGSFADVLGHGANLFLADDHEFWNNYPFASYKANTWTPSLRSTSTAIARALFCAFQTDYQAAGSGVQGLDIGPAGRPELSLRALDCRYFRTRSEFAPDADIRAICSWLAGLECPGVLVLSQPLLEPAADWFMRRIKDAGLADFPASYVPLLQALRRPRHDVVILSGDIHCGRVSSVDLGQGRTLWEVVSSPVALCAGSYHDDGPVGVLPRTHTPGPSLAVTSASGPELVRCDHHALLELSRKGAGVLLKIRFEALDGGSRPLPSIQEITLT